MPRVMDVRKARRRLKKVINWVWNLEPETLIFIGAFTLAITGLIEGFSNN